MDRYEYKEMVKKTASDVYEEWVRELKEDPHNRYYEDKLTELLDSNVDSDLPDCNSVMEHTDNEDAADDVGVEPTGKWRDILQQFCYWAYRADVHEAFYNTYDVEETVREIRGEDDEDEDEDEGEDAAPRRHTTKEAFTDDDAFDGVKRRPRLLDMFRRRR